MKDSKTNNTLTMSELIDKLNQMCMENPNDHDLGRKLRSEISTIKKDNGGD
jgi:hypothetical protein